MRFEVLSPFITGLKIQIHNPHSVAPMLGVTVLKSTRLLEEAGPQELFVSVPGNVKGGSFSLFEVL